MPRGGGQRASRGVDHRREHLRGDHHVSHPRHAGRGRGQRRARAGGCVGGDVPAIYVTFFTSYAEAIETILQCFCEDMERNDGTPLRQYYMPESLKKLTFEEVKGQVMPSETDADDKFELEMKEARKTRREAKRERRRVRESQAGSQSGGGASSMSGSYT